MSDIVVREHDAEIAPAELAWEHAARRLDAAQALVRKMAALCRGPSFVAEIQGRRYPTVAWWTTVGAALGLFPVEVSCERLDRDGEVAYLAVVEVRDRSGRTVTRASAMCSSAERHWRKRDEYAIRSMAITRATGKAYRLGLAFLAVLAGLEPTPAEEMPGDTPEPTPAPSPPQRPDAPRASFSASAFWERLYAQHGHGDAVQAAGREALQSGASSLDEALEIASSILGEVYQSGESSDSPEANGKEG